MKQTDDLEIQPLREVGRILWMMTRVMNPDSGYESQPEGPRAQGREHLPYWDQIPHTRFLFW